MSVIQFNYNAGIYEGFERDYAIALVPINKTAKWMVVIDGLPVDLVPESAVSATDAAVHAKAYCEEVNAVAEFGADSRTEYLGEVSKVLINHHNIFEYEQRELSAAWFESQVLVAA